MLYGNQPDQMPPKSSVKLNRFLVLFVLIAVFIGLFATNVNRVRSITAFSLLRYSVDNTNESLARISLWLADELEAEINILLRQAVRRNQIDKAKLLLTLDGEPNLIIDKDFSALYWCALNNYVEVAGLLIKAGADIDVKPYKGWSALSVAIYYGHNELAKVLIDAGAKTGSKIESIKNSPLWVAVAKGSLEIIERLLAAGIDTNVVIPSEISGRRPTSVVDYALLKKQYKAAKRLIREHGPSRLTDENVAGEPFITNYCLAGIQRVLTRRAYVDFKRTDINPIIDAMEKGAADEMVLDLIDGHPQEIDREDETGETPLMAAVERGWETVVKRLIERGCDVNKSDGNGYSAALVAAEEGALPIFRMLIRAGFDPQRSGCRDDSLFNFLIHRELIEPMKILVEERVNLDMSDSMGTPLQIALSYGRDEFARVLLEGGADPTIRAGHYLKAPVDTIREKPAHMALKQLLEEQAEKRNKDAQWIIKGGVLSGEDRLHVISVHKGRNSRQDQISRIPVTVLNRSKPVILLLNSQEPVLWQVQTKPGVILKAVYVLGRSPSDVVGVDDSTLRFLLTKDEEQYLKPWVVDNKDDFLEMIEGVEKITGSRPATIQSNYAGSHFTVDGIETIDFYHPVLKYPPNKAIILKSGEGGDARISGEGLICDYGRSGAFSTAVANTAYNAGKWYFEAVVNPNSADNQPDIYTNVGMLSPHEEHPSFSSSSGGGSGYSYGLPREFQRQLRAGDVVSVAVNLDDHCIHFGMNGQWIEGSPDILLSGKPIKDGRDYTAGVAVSADSDEGSDQIVVNFGASPFIYQVPDGFLSYSGNQLLTEYNPSEGQ